MKKAKGKIAKKITRSLTGEEQGCKKGPSGWYCKRNKGHEGPCALIKVGAPVPRDVDYF